MSYWGLLPPTFIDIIYNKWQVRTITTCTINCFLVKSFYAWFYFSFQYSFSMNFYQDFLIWARQRGCIYSESKSGFWDVSLLNPPSRDRNQTRKTFVLFFALLQSLSSPLQQLLVPWQDLLVGGIVGRNPKKRIELSLQSKHHVSPRRAHLVYLVQKCCHLESEFNKNGCKSLFLRSLKQTGLWVEVKRSWYISDFLKFFLLYFVI